MVVRAYLKKEMSESEFFCANDRRHVNHRWHHDGALCFCAEPPCTRRRGSSSGSIRDQYRRRCLLTKDVNVGAHSLAQQRRQLWSFDTNR